MKLIRKKIILQIGPVLVQPQNERNFVDDLNRVITELNKSYKEKKLLNFSSKWNQELNSHQQLLIDVEYEFIIDSPNIPQPDLNLLISEPNLQSFLKRWQIQKYVIETRILTETNKPKSSEKLSLSWLSSSVSLQILGFIIAVIIVILILLSRS
ncbi:MAG: hypothetical protein ACIWVG_15605 [Gloeotrichia echinulata HAB0833]